MLFAIDMTPYSDDIFLFQAVSNCILAKKSKMPIIMTTCWKMNGILIVMTYQVNAHSNYFLVCFSIFYPEHQNFPMGKCVRRCLKN